MRRYNDPLIRLSASWRDMGLSRNNPRTAEVTVIEPGLHTPLILMQRCSASTTTTTPFG